MMAPSPLFIPQPVLWTLLGYQFEAQDRPSHAEIDPGPGIFYVETLEEVDLSVKVSFLAPQIVKCIVEGRHPADLTPRDLMEVELPSCWTAQHAMLGIG